MDWNKIRAYWWGYVYDKYFGNDIDDIELLLSLIGQKPSNIFEVCCGSGRIIVPLAKCGHSVSGIDADEGMLARIPAKAEGLNNLKYSFANALTIDWGMNHDVVILACNTIMNIEHRDDDKTAQQLFIKKAADALKAGGHFFIAFDHYFVPENVFVGENKITEGFFNGTDDKGVHGQFYHCGGLYNPVTQIAIWAGHLEMTLATGEKNIFTTHGHKYVCTRYGVHDWLKGAGFVIEEEFGNYDRIPFNEESKQVVIWARKV